MRVTLNGAERAVPPGSSVADLAAMVGVAPGERGTAVALDGGVVPGTAWATTIVPGGARLEVVRAVAGG